MKKFIVTIWLILLAMPLACKADEPSFSADEPLSFINLSLPDFQGKRIERKKRNFPKEKIKKKNKNKHKKKDKKNKKYVLAIIPKGHFGEKLHKYWRVVKTKGLMYKPITEAQPHCKLTHFFASKLTAGGFKKVLEDTLFTMKIRKIPRKIVTGGLFQGNAKKNHHDYIKVKSPFLRHFGEEFIKRMKLHPGIIADTHMPFHISLREDIFEKKKQLEWIQKLQRGVMQHNHSPWSVGIFKKVGDRLELLTSIKIR